MSQLSENNEVVMSENNEVITSKNNGNSDDDIVLSVNHVGKYFKLPTEQATGLKQAFINLTKGIKGYY